MRPLQARLVTLCQQVLALGVVLVVLTPASGVVSLDIVGGHPGQLPPAGASLVSATVPTRAVTPTVTEVPLTGTDGSFAGLQGRTVAGGATAARVQSKPQAVTGFAAIGVTWKHGEDLDEDQINLVVRTRTGDSWTDWEALEYHDEHGPDDGSAEAAASRPGTEPMFVGDVDDVQVRASTDGVTLPDDLSLALVDPGAASSSETEAPAEVGTSAPADEEYDGSRSMLGSDGITLQSSTTSAKAQAVAQPTIFSRAQWGADESHAGRGRAALRRGCSGGFVHHTVNANDYTEARGAGDPARHLRLPRAVPGLERHRLQLPRRPVRPGLGGPLRRGRPAGRGRAHAGLQRRLVRDVARSATSRRPCSRPDVPCCEAYGQRSSRGSCRCTA
jgi:hypothetical protein